MNKQSAEGASPTTFTKFPNKSDEKYRGHGFYIYYNRDVDAWLVATRHTLQNMDLRKWLDDNDYDGIATHVLELFIEKVVLAALDP